MRSGNWAGGADVFSLQFCTIQSSVAAFASQISGQFHRALPAPASSYSLSLLIQAAQFPETALPQRAQRRNICRVEGALKKNYACKWVNLISFPPAGNVFALLYWPRRAERSLKGLSHLHGWRVRRLLLMSTRLGTIANASQRARTPTMSADECVIILNH